MRKKSILIMGTLLFMSWGTIQLYLFVNKPQSQRNNLSAKIFSWYIRGRNSSGKDDDDKEILNNNFRNDAGGKFSENNLNNLAINKINNKQSIDGFITNRINFNNNNSHHNILPFHHIKSKILNKNNNDNINNINNNDSKINKNNTNNKNQLDFDMISMQIEYLEHDLSKQTKLTEVMLRLLKQIQLLATMKNQTISEVVNDRVLLKSLIEPPPSNQKPVICVLLFACNRVTVKRNLDQLFKYRKDPEIFPIVVSQDCNHEPTRQVIKSYGDQLTYIQQPDQSDIVLKGKSQKKFKGYYKISRHYGWALNFTFNVMNYETVLIVEDDLDIAPDFFEYFLALYPILRSDPSLYCISAWNDNGKQKLVEDDSTKLFRSDFFPGLGWMMTKDLWMEFQNKWPKAFWDDWIREPEQRKNRACIRPELSRTKTFGKKGVSNGLFYENHLKYIKLNEKFVPFTKMNLSYLLKENYDVEFLKQVYNSRLMSLYDIKNLPRNYPQKQNQLNDLNSSNLTSLSPLASKNSLRVQYDDKNQFKKAAKIFGLMDDFKSGVPRTGYRGTVGFMYHGYRVYLAPSPIWNGYNITWK